MGGWIWRTGVTILLFVLVSLDICANDSARMLFTEAPVVKRLSPATEVTPSQRAKNEPKGFHDGVNLSSGDRLTQMVQAHIDAPWPDPCSSVAASRSWGLAAYALAALHGGQDTATANRYIEQFCREFRVPDDGSSDFTSYFQLPLLWRIYCDPVMNARLTTGPRQQIEEMMWHWIDKRSQLRDADGSVWKIDDSENHDAIRKSGYLLCSEALSAWGPPYGPDRALHDGNTIREHAAAWSRYWQSYFAQRAREGLSCEIASAQYARYTLGCYYNIRDYARSARLRQTAQDFIILYWADTACDYLATGIRGGAQTRVYQCERPTDRAR